MKQFIYKVLALSLPIILLVIGINYFGDAANVFDSEYEKKMVKIILNDKYVTNIQNYDERIFQEELISEIKFQPEIVIIGSSRTMLISSAFFSKQSLLNSSVSGAGLKDITAIYQIYKSNNKIPKKIIIGIDPWLLNENNIQSRWLSISSYYNQFHHKKEIPFISHKRFKQLFSLSYFQFSLKRLYKDLLENTNPIPTNERFNKTNTKLTDGSLVYGFEFKNASSKEIEIRIQSYLNNKLYNIDDFRSISDKSWKEFVKVLDDMKNNGVEVELFLAPYAPLVYNEILDNYPMVIRSEEKIRNLALSKNIRLYGSFNPFELNMDNSYFYDGMHCNEKGIEKVLNTITVKKQEKNQESE